MTVVSRRAALLVPLAVLLLSPAARAQDTAAVEFFEKKVRPVLVEQCLGCHGEPGKKVKGGLRLTTRTELLTGGDSGPAVVPGKPDQSPLIRAVRYDGDLKMPPKAKLRESEIADLTKWVKAGAVWPGEARGGNTPGSSGPLFTPEQKAFWAFQPVKPPAVPPIADCRSPIDAFILAKLS